MSSQKNEGGDSSKIVGNMPKWRELMLPALNWGEILVNLRTVLYSFTHNCQSGRNEDWDDDPTRRYLLRGLVGQGSSHDLASQTWEIDQ